MRIRNQNIDFFVNKQNLISYQAKIDILSYFFIPTLFYKEKMKPKYLLSHSDE